MKNLFSRAVLCLAAVFVLCGCSSLQYAGNASYSVTPLVIDAARGVTICCAVEIRDGKERASLDLHVVKSGDGYDITLTERGVLAFQGQVVALGGVQEAGKTATAAALAPVLPSVGAMLAAPGIGSAALGAAAGMGVSNFMAAPSNESGTGLRVPK